MKAIQILSTVVFVLVFSLTTNAQNSGLCTGRDENAKAGDTVEKMTGGFNPDKMDRVKSDGIRGSICDGKERPEKAEKPDRDRPNQAADRARRD